MSGVTRFAEAGAGSAAYRLLLVALLALAGAGIWAAHRMDGAGHVITGMDNQVVWGLPHVAAVFLILAASGALNAATLASVFGRAAYKPLARLSAVLAIALLCGGLAILVLDLGRPERLIVAITHYNFRSIFAWNIFLYSGFVLIAAVYAWALMAPRRDPLSRPVGLLAFTWRLVLTTGTGCIFGFLVARQAFDAAIMAPLFVAMSFAFGGAVFLAVSLVSFGCTRRELDPALVQRQVRLLAMFVLATLYLSAALHLTNLYLAEHRDGLRLLLWDGAPYPRLFWIGYVGLGSLLPLALLWSARLARQRALLLGACLLVVAGGLAHLYVIVIGGQALPLALFPGQEVSSSFFDGTFNAYSASLYEYLLGFGGFALSALLLSIAIRVLPIVPERIAAAESAQPGAATAR